MGRLPLMIDYDFGESYLLSLIFSVLAFFTTLFAGATVRLYAARKGDVTTSVMAAELPVVHAVYRAYTNSRVPDILRAVLTVVLCLLSLHNVALWALSEKVIRQESITLPVFNGPDGDLNITLRSSSTFYLSTESFDSTGEDNVLMVRDATDIFYRNESRNGYTFTLDEYNGKITGRYSELSFGSAGECQYFGTTQRCNLTRPPGTDFAEFVGGLDVVYNVDAGDTVTISIPTDTASVTTGISLSNYLKSAYADYYKAYYTLSEGSGGLLTSLLGGVFGNLTGTFPPSLGQVDYTVRVTAKFDDGSLQMQLCGDVDISSSSCAVVEVMSKRLTDRRLAQDIIGQSQVDVFYTALFASQGFGEEQADALKRADKLKRLYLAAVEPQGTGTKTRSVVKFRFSWLVFVPLAISLLVFGSVRLATLGYLPHLTMSVTEMLTLITDNVSCLGELNTANRKYDDMYLVATEPVVGLEDNETKPGHIGISNTKENLATKKLDEYNGYQGSLTQ